jgi:hypothetical protein
MLLFVERHRTERDGIVFTSRATCAYHAGTGTWRGVSINSRANRAWREVSFANGEVRIFERGELVGGGRGFRRFVYSALRDGTFDCRMDRSDDGIDWQDGGYGFRARRMHAE